MRFLYFLTLLLLMGLSNCGNQSLYSQKMNGFDKGKRTFKTEERLNETVLDNGETGFKWDTSFRWAVGNKRNRSTVRSSVLNSDYSFVRTEMTRIRDGEQTRVQALDVGPKITVSVTGGEAPANHAIDHEGPVFLGFPAPMLAGLAKEMKPGEVRGFDLLLDEAGEIKRIGLRFVGEENVFRSGKEILSYHFKQQAPTAMEEWDDYFVEVATGDIVKINMGQIEFLPAE
jgi:hypothetical protein